MKKRILALITVIMSVIICFSATGCNLVTKDSERDMKQIVAKVKISDDIETENIYKKDMIMAYLNYGYYYVQYYNYTQEAVFTLILDNLLQNRILIQNIMTEREKASENINGEFNKGDIRRYINADQELEAQYNTYKAINDLLDSYETNKEDKASDTLAMAVRTVPTNAKNAEKDVNKSEYVKKGFDISSSAGRRDAYNSLIKLMRNNGLIGDDYKGKIESTSYFNETLKGYRENELLNSFQNKIKSDARKVSYDTLKKEFEKLKTEQKDFSLSEFKTALSSNSAKTPIIYNQYGSYGYVYNILIGVNDYQKEQISAIKTDDPNISDNDYKEKRAGILRNTTVTDLRSSWILSGYDFDGVKFTGDYTFTSPENSLKFYGKVNKVAEATETENAKYTVDSVDVFGLEDFVSLIDKYIYGEDKSDNYQGTNKSVYRAVSSSDDIKEYDEKINELLFAFSTDPGSLNTYKGYSISPDNSENFVEDFWKVGKELIAEDYGTNGYVVVASDYGYHVMFYSEILKLNFEYADLTAYLNDVFGVDKDDAYWSSEVEKMLSNWDDLETDETNSYLYNLIDSLTRTKVDNALSGNINEIVNKYRYEEKGCVTVYEKAYKDLLG